MPGAGLGGAPPSYGGAPAPAKPWSQWRMPLAPAAQLLRDRMVTDDGPIRVGDVLEQNAVIEHQTLPADPAYAPLGTDVRARKSQHVARHARTVRSKASCGTSERSAPSSARNGT